MWEYKVTVGSALTEEVLNTLGADGWELCLQRNESGYAPRLVFKRPLKEQAAAEPPAPVAESPAA